MWNRTILVLTFLPLLASLEHAEKLPLKNYTTADGLAQDRVNRIVRDSRGFLWFCTGEGLSRFDGYQFRNYTRDDGLPHRNITDLLELPDGEYWVATGDGLALFNPQGVARRWRGSESYLTASDESLMFRVFRPEEATTDRWGVNKLQLDANGTLWATTTLGLYRAVKAGREWKFQRADQQEWSAKRDFETLILDKYGALWVAGIEGVYRLLPDGKVQIIARDLSIISLLQDKAGNIWAGTRGESRGGLHEFSVNGLDQPKLAHTFTMKDGLTGNFWHNALLETTDGSFWVGGFGLCERIAQPGQ
jgi:ligand-binding sensor domain-containing protein